MSENKKFFKGRAGDKVKVDREYLESLANEVRGSAWSGGRSLVSLADAAGNVLSFKGYPVESSYEFFTGGITIQERNGTALGRTLYREDSRCFGAYDFRAYHEGPFDSVAEVLDHLSEKYKGVRFTVGCEQVEVDLDEELPRTYEKRAVVPSRSDNSPKRAKKSKPYVPAKYAEKKESDLERLVWVDEGVDESGEGRRVSFAYACDLKTYGSDEPMANPYLKTMRAGEGGVYHYVSLPADVYDRLRDVSGAGDGRWSGCVESLVYERKSVSGYTNRYPDLSEAARRSGFLRQGEGFDAAKHDRFVKASLKERYSELPSVDAVGQKETGTQYE